MRKFWPAGVGRSSFDEDPRMGADMMDGWLGSGSSSFITGWCCCSGAAAAAGVDGIASSLAFSAFSLSLASRCSFVTNVILIFFISPASLSTADSSCWTGSGPAIDVRLLEVADAAAVVGLDALADDEAEELSVGDADFFRPFKLKGIAASFAAAAALPRVFLTVSGVPAAAVVRTLIDDSGLMLCEVSGRE